MTEVRASTTSRSGRESTKARSTSSSAQRPTLKSQRLVSEAFLHVKAPQRSRSPASFNDQATHNHTWDDEQDDEHDEKGSPIAGRKRRYTINTVEDCELPPRLMLPQHLQADVALRVASVLLRTKEKELADLAHSLQVSSRTLQKSSVHQPDNQVTARELFVRSGHQVARADVPSANVSFATSHRRSRARLEPDVATAS